MSHFSVITAKRKLNQKKGNISMKAWYTEMKNLFAAVAFKK